VLNEAIFGAIDPKQDSQMQLEQGLDWVVLANRPGVAGFLFWKGREFF